MSDVYFIRFNEKDLDSRLNDFEKVIIEAGLEPVKSGGKCAVKMHFGEPGCTTFLKPEYIKTVVKHLKNAGVKPFLTDSNTLYKGHRGNGKDHLKVVEKHGFSESETGAPAVIADGEDSSYVIEKNMKLNHFGRIRYGKAADDADSLVVVSHFKGHLVFGFGGALKNVGMGFGSRSAKQAMHADVRPEIIEGKCIGCGTCKEVCPADAIEMQGDVPVVDMEKCEGCADCITHCPEEALKIQWDGSPAMCMEKTAEVAYAVLEDKKDKTVYYNIITDVTPDCDCMPKSETPLTNDIGILVSTDPVAIDQASVDLVKQEPGRKDSKLETGLNAGDDKFKALRPNIDGEHILEYGEKIGLGYRKYNLIEV